MRYLCIALCCGKATGHGSFMPLLRAQQPWPPKALPPGSQKGLPIFQCGHRCCQVSLLLSLLQINPLTCQEGDLSLG